ncbi:cell division protein FtsX [Desulfofustis glycolicus]|uniref:Cell division protein FtsX n=1 Tax=Desulfofustis glycolicus DSM 9705 TaxID=1121409 RepID=A0A1M5X943_9BACT|nr:permease-like cell division protein FtsX [Desulfofustis glycolicus]MCB2218145.1 ABC transporter permease [Desulfobulbaceae bacterium]SHH96340.1 cell division protein FtsX [Desulfofustis glycolicus DSM 9705]
MSFWLAVLRQVARNLRQTWPSQFMTLLTVSLSVLIFAFFYLVYMNMLGVGDKLGDDLRLIVYLEEEPGPEMQEQLRRKILAFDEVEQIRFISKAEAYQRFADQLGNDRDVLDDMPRDFLPASIEVVPLKNLRSLSQVKLFSDYLARLPGTLKVQYGQDWIERFYYFTRLLSIVVLLSGGLLIMTTVFMVSYTIRLTILGRQAELELLRLVGATNNYIRTPFLIEGVLQGILGSTVGIISLYTLFHWIKLRFSGPGILTIFEFSFFQGPTVATIIFISVLLCTVGSYLSMQKFLRI